MVIANLFNIEKKVFVVEDKRSKERTSIKLAMCTTILIKYLQLEDFLSKIWSAISFPPHYHFDVGVPPLHHTIPSLPHPHLLYPVAIASSPKFDAPIVTSHPRSFLSKYHANPNNARASCRLYHQLTYTPSQHARPSFERRVILC